ncbi:MAG: hypothetical protein JWO62_84 [Acidimicrobiaceae bacterium]|nr:hypothetical protein [Acidimicrobiaceae bacterium]
MPAEKIAPSLELVVPELRWFWGQLATQADRRGDPDMSTGTLSVVAPESSEERAAAIGICGKVLAAGQRRRVDLAELVSLTEPLSPGEVAASVLGRPLAERRLAADGQRAREAELCDALRGAVPDLDSDAIAALRSSGAIKRLSKISDAEQVVEHVGAVMRDLPDGPGMVDRRLLALVAGSPHALDAGQPVAGMCLSLLSALGRVEAGMSARDAWAAVGVVYDDITGGLSVVGLVPDGWTVPEHAPVTLPPKALARCTWPAGRGRVVFVTENPSVLSAAAGIAGARAICTTGTPSRLEITSLGKLAAAGWRLAIRADFDDTGLTNTAAILGAVPDALAWRMGATDYLGALQASRSVEPLRLDRLGQTPWDPELAAVMRHHGVAVFEETLLDDLLDDIAHA